MGKQPRSRATAHTTAATAEQRADDGRLLRQTLLIAAVIIAALLIWQLSHILLLVFGAILVAIVLRTVAEPFERFARLPPRLAVLAALVSLLVLIALGGWAFGREISSQTSDLTDRLPEAWQAARGQLASLPFGPEVVERIDSLIDQVGQDDEAGAAQAPAGDGEGAPGAAPAPPAAEGGLLSGGVFANVGAFAGMVASVIAELMLVIFAGLFLALNPQSYKAGFVRLFQKRSASTAETVGKAFDVSGTGLRRWLLGQLAAMVAVGVVTGLGAWAIGLPSPLALGMIAGVLEFVPIIGPIVATIPALLLAATMGPEMILWTLLLYLVIQQIEGNLIMPLVQKRMVSLPPVIALFSILIFAALFGPLGVLLATPLAVVVFVLIKGVYLDEPISEKDAASSK
jgi:predicted PurR-regulated permease PerM